MTYPEPAGVAAMQMWKRGLSAHAIAAALDRQHPMADRAWELRDVHAAISQRQRQDDLAKAERWVREVRELRRTVEAVEVEQAEHDDWVAAREAHEAFTFDAVEGER